VIFAQKGKYEILKTIPILRNNFAIDFTSHNGTVYVRPYGVWAVKSLCTIEAKIFCKLFGKLMKIDCPNIEELYILRAFK
jgi:hypothetical protein